MLINSPLSNLLPVLFLGLSFAAQGQQQNLKAEVNGAPATGKINGIQSEVITLSTCDPNSTTVLRSIGGIKKSERITKLEVRNKTPSVFCITGINPLRFKYYINNEAVTQFLEQNAVPFSINSFVNGEYLLTAPEIKIPEIFKVDSLSAQAKSRIRDYQGKSIAIGDSIEMYNNRIQDRWDELFLEIKGDSQKIAKTINEDVRYKKLFSQVDRFHVLYDKNILEYQKYIAGLPINNPRFGILEEYRHFDSSQMQEPAIRKIQRFEKQFADEYLDHTARFKLIDSLIDEMEMRSLSDSAESLLRTSLRYYNFTFSQRKYYNFYSSSFVQDNKNDIREQILNKRFQLYEEFVMNVATKIGALVQNQFMEYSAFNNKLENFASITPDSLQLIEKKRQTLTQTFEFIQKTSAELQIMVSYLDINTALYQSIAKQINSNYLFLLSYLKNLDFVSKENAIQYTLPTHTNLKNIDIIRYTVKREDKKTQNQQTYNYDFWVKGGLKIDFSAGFFASGLTDNVYNKVLLDASNNIEKISITRQDDGRMNFAFGGMVNVTPRNGSSWINVGGSVGIAYSSNQKLQVLTGIAIHFGKTERIILHGGVAFGTIKYLDISANNFKFFDKELNSVSREKLNTIKERDRVYMLESQDIKFASYTIPTLDKFVVRPFFGVSYNLSKKNALQAVSGTAVKTYSDNFSNPVSY